MAKRSGPRPTPSLGSVRLEKFLAKRGLTLAQFAFVVGVTKGHVGLLTQGRVTPSLALAIRIEERTEGAIKCADWTCQPAKKRSRPAAAPRTAL